MSTVNKAHNDLLELATQNRVRNVMMDESNKKTMAYFLETVTLCALRKINTPVVEPQNYFSESSSPTVLDDSVFQVLV